MNNKKHNSFNDNFEDLDNICENCKKNHESVTQNLILIGFKICESCKLSKLIFPL